VAADDRRDDGRDAEHHPMSDSTCAAWCPHSRSRTTARGTTATRRHADGLRDARGDEHADRRASAHAADATTNPPAP
jgi:hypothetical protein